MAYSSYAPYANSYISPDRESKGGPQHQPRPPAPSAPVPISGGDPSHQTQPGAPPSTSTAPVLSPVTRNGGIPPQQQPQQQVQSQGQVSHTGGGGGQQQPVANTPLPNLAQWGVFTPEQTAILQKRWNEMSPEGRAAWLNAGRTEQLRQISITFPGWQPGGGSGGGGVTPPVGGGGGGTPIAGGPLPSVHNTYATRSNNTVYTPGQLPQLNLPDVQPQENQQMALLSQILQNPLSMSDQGVAQLKAKQQEQALAEQQNLLASLQQNVASRGTLGGGYEAATTRRVGDTTNATMLGALRDIDIAKMQQDMQDRINAVNVANPAIQGKFERGMTGQGAIQQRAVQQEGLNQAGAASNLASYQSDLDAYFQAQDAIAKLRQLAIQQQLGQGSIGVDQQRIAESARQFNLGNVLDWAKLRSGDDLGRLGIGVDTANLNQSNQNNLMKLLFPNGF